MDPVLNLVFFVFHSAWIGFNCIGWAWRRTRPWQLGTVALTALSWFGLGAWYGWGYCPCTDWHWAVRARLGYRDPPSYIQLLFHEFAGLDVPLVWANTLAVVALVGSAALGVTLLLRDRKP